MRPPNEAGSSPEDRQARVSQSHPGLAEAGGDGLALALAKEVYALNPPDIAEELCQLVID